MPRACARTIRTRSRTSRSCAPASRRSATSSARRRLARGRLDRLITDQRTLLDDARGAWLAIKQAGGADPLAQQGTLTHLADARAWDRRGGRRRRRSRLRRDRRDRQEARRQAERRRACPGRPAQNLDLYLLDGRTRIAEARRKLQELAAEEGVVKAEAALTALKRAREQLLDPITVLRGVAQDELVILQETTYAAAAAGTLELGPDQKPQHVPAWLASPLIGERQGGLAIDSRRSAPGSPRRRSSRPTPPPRRRRIRSRQAPRARQDRTALGHRGERGDGPRREALGGTGSGPRSITSAPRWSALAAAIEQFGDLKQTVELAYGDHHQLVTMLGPRPRSR